MGEKEYDEKRDKEKKEEKQEEEILRMEIRRRRKEKCKKRSTEIHENEDKNEDNKQKRRKLDKDGKYKKVIQKTGAEKARNEKGEEDQTSRKKRRVEIVRKEPYKVIGGEWKGMELAEKVDWQKRRIEIIERLEKEEKESKNKIEKAKRLQRSWELTIVCSNLLKEFSNNWTEIEERRKDEEKERKRYEQIQKASNKKAAFMEKEKVRNTTRKITDMLASIPLVEAEKIEKEIRQKEKIQLSTVKKNLWKKWRGKMKVKESKYDVEMRDSDKVQKKLDEIEKKVEEYKKKREEKLKRKEMKRKDWIEKHRMIVEDHWGMLNWLHKFIEDNKYEWERRRINEKIESNKEYETWKGMEEEEMIEILKKYEEKGEEESTKERAKRKKGNWQKWREEEKEEIIDKLPKDDKDLDTFYLDMEEKKEMTSTMKRKRKEWKKEKGEIRKEKVTIKEGKNEPRESEEPPLDPQRLPESSENENNTENIGKINEEEKIEPRKSEEPQLDPDRLLELQRNEINDDEDEKMELRLSEEPEVVPSRQSRPYNITEEYKELEDMLMMIGGQEGRQLCMDCAYYPCICMIRSLEDKIRKLQEERIYTEEGTKDQVCTNELNFGSRKEENLEINDEEGRKLHADNEEGCIEKTGVAGQEDRSKTGDQDNSSEGDKKVGTLAAPIPPYKSPTNDIPLEDNLDPDQTGEDTPEKEEKEEKKGVLTLLEQMRQLKKMKQEERKKVEELTPKSKTKKKNTASKTPKSKQKQKQEEEEERKLEGMRLKMKKWQKDDTRKKVEEKKEPVVVEEKVIVVDVEKTDYDRKKTPPVSGFQAVRSKFQKKEINQEQQTYEEWKSKRKRKLETPVDDRNVRKKDDRMTSVIGPRDSKWESNNKSNLFNSCKSNDGEGRPVQCEGGNGGGDGGRMDINDCNVLMPKLSAGVVNVVNFDKDRSAAAVLGRKLV